MSAALVQIDVAVRFLVERGATRQNGTWIVENHPLASDPINAARQLRAWLISKGPANSRQADGRAIWTR
jgi:hypothetical protein